MQRTGNMTQRTGTMIFAFTGFMSYIQRRTGNNTQSAPLPLRRGSRRAACSACSGPVPTRFPPAALSKPDPIEEREIPVPKHHTRRNVSKLILKPFIF